MRRLPDELRAAIVFFALAALLLVALLISLIGCAPDRASTRPPAPSAVSRGGVPIALPAWAVSYTAEIEDEIDRESPPVPAGWSVAVRLPVFESPASPSGLARGEAWYAGQELRVGWREWPYEQDRLLPALGHEIGHAYGGPEAGH